MPVIDRLATEQVGGALDQAGDAHIGAQQIVGNPGPAEQLGALARRIDDLDRLAGDPRIVTRESRQGLDFGGAEQARQEQEAVALESRDLIGAEPLERRPHGGGGQIMNGGHR